MFQVVGQENAQLLSEEVFLRMLSRERKRAERFGKAFLLMLVETSSIFRNGDLGRLGSVVAEAVRETDLFGWLDAGSAMGVIFAELGETEPEVAANVIENKLTAALQASLSSDALNGISISFVECSGSGTGEKLIPASYSTGRPLEVASTTQFSPPQRSTFPAHVPSAFYSTGNKLGFGLTAAPRGCECSKCKAARLAV